jgi:hypothetical protein
MNIDDLKGMTFESIEKEYNTYDYPIVDDFAVEGISIDYKEAKAFQKRIEKLRKEHGSVIK